MGAACGMEYLLMAFGRRDYPGHILHLSGGESRRWLYQLSDRFCFFRAPCCFLDRRDSFDLGRIHHPTVGLTTRTFPRRAEHKSSC